ncbi:VOC family protein [Nakamurella endophytica]|uniref:Glyoxalase n=1 Tax=Nakamurella endophytica TaxID=1748367 RepID=A0A917SUU6_9ACTN|nr:VOC family protein [Nakamurella endophytica]GGL98625.1 glyoxalase [Nakamurella endophytica]
MAEVTGVGGVFWRADDPERLRSWYADVLGIVDPPGGAWQQEAGPMVLAPFPRDTDYFGPGQQLMLNFRVRDLAGLLDRLRDRGVEVQGPESQDGVGTFAWVRDPEGSRVELWEPAGD